MSVSTIQESKSDGAPGWNPTLRQRIVWIWEFWRPHRAFLFMLLFLTLVSSSVAIAYPLVFRTILDRIAASLGDIGATGGGAVDRETLIGVLQILAIIAVGRFIAGLYPAFRAWVNLKIDVGVREKVFASVLEKDYGFFNRFRTGDLVTRLMDDITEYPKLAWFSCSGIFRAFDAGSRLVLCVVAMLFLDWKLSLIAVLPLPLMFSYIYHFRKRLSDAYEEQQQSISQTNDMLEATFSGIRIVKAFGAEPGQTGALGRLLDGRIGIQFRVQRMFAMVQILDTIASRCGQLIVLAVGGIMVVRGDLTLGTLYAFYIYLDMMVEPMVDLPNLLVTSRQAFVCMDREEEVLRYPVDFVRPMAGRELDQIRKIEFDRVQVAYGRRESDESELPAALKDVSFTIGAGEKIAVVGAVASGKTTLLKTIAGLLAPASGEIRINDWNLNGYDWDGYRRRIGYTPQESHLFSETIRENIQLGRTRDLPESPAAWTARMLSMVQMRTEVDGMSDGIETVLGQKGSRVSGGQRQRLSIARAVYGRPEVLLLDDCTASLDAANEFRLWMELDKIAPGAIVLIVSHRLATIRRADRILVLDHGRLVDTGTHEELAGRSECYRRFLEREQEREQITAPRAGGSP